MPIAFRKRRYPIVTPNQAIVKLEDGIWHPVWGHNRYSVALGKNMFVCENAGTIVGVLEPDFISLHDLTTEDNSYDIVCKYNVMDLIEAFKQKEYTRQLLEREAQREAQRNQDAQRVTDAINQVMRERAERMREGAVYYNAPINNNYIARALDG